DRLQGGLGIGLSLVRSIVRFHDGSVTIRGRATGTGTEFTVSLPRHIELPVLAPTGGGKPVPLLAKILQIMIADDDRDAALMLSMLLDAAGHETFVEHNGLHALERARAEPPDICMLNIDLPDMDGNEIARQLRSTEAIAQPVLIAVTGDSQNSDQKTSFEAGFDHYLVKPVDLKKLIALLAELGEASNSP
ncbi:MAG: hybrid sensor histidine kinase/response regulator, partial [Nitrosospira sp.]